MKRFAFVWLPEFAIHRMRRSEPGSVPPDTPLALVASSPRGVVITAVNRAAANGGIHAGQMLADARAIRPGLVTRPAAAERDARMLAHLALWLGRYGPLRNRDGTDGLWDGLWVDITGVAHLFGGEQALARDCVGRLERAGFGVRIGIADTRSGARALARHVAMPELIAIAPVGETRRALASLPVESLQLSEDLIILLRRLGLKSVGQLYPLPRAALARRFREAAPNIRMARRHRRGDPVRISSASGAGLAETLVLRLDQALGEISEPLAGVEEPPVYRVQRSFAEPLISHQALFVVLDDLAEDLCALLDDNEAGGRRVRVSLCRADGTCATATVRTSRPVRDRGHIRALLEPRLERLDAGLGLDAVVLEALATEALVGRQMGLAAPDVSHAGAAVLVDRLVNRLGIDAVFHLEEVASHIPERAQRRVAVLRRGPRVLGREQAAHKPTAPRPAFLLEPAERITVIAEVPEGPPARFTWRRVTRRVICAEGPERIAPEWWRLIGLVADQVVRRNVPGGGVVEHAGGMHRTASAPTGTVPPPAIPADLRIRDYYRVEDEHGGRYWIYRSGLYAADAAGGMGETTDDVAVSTPPAWYLHGVF